MDENPSRVSRLDPTVEASPRIRSSKSTKIMNRHRYPVDDGGDHIEYCSGEHCASCTASLVADCIAVCCCPCAIVNVLVLAFVKVPWMMGRRCLRFMKKKRRRLERSKNHGRKSSSSSTKENYKDGVIERGRGRGREMVVEDIKVENPSGVPLVDGEFEAEKVWLELYQVGHFGFDRVSFYGNQGKG